MTPAFPSPTFTCFRCIESSSSKVIASRIETALLESNIMRGASLTSIRPLGSEPARGDCSAIRPNQPPPLGSTQVVKPMYRVVIFDFFSDLLPHQPRLPLMAASDNLRHGLVHLYAQVFLCILLLASQILSCRLLLVWRGSSAATPFLFLLPNTLSTLKTAIAPSCSNILC